MDRQQEYVLRMVEERDIRFIQLWFSDVVGTLKSVAIAPAELEAAELLPPQADRPTVAIMAKEAAAARALVLFLIFMDFSFSSWSPKTFPPPVAVTFINNLVCDVVHASSAALPFATL